MTEVWKAVPGFEGLYEVSDQGRVRSLDRDIMTGDRWGNSRVNRIRGKTLTSSFCGTPYLRVNLCKNGRRSPRSVASIVAEVFIGPRPTGQEVRHLDGHAANNKAANLAYGTPQQNTQDKLRHGTIPRGEDSSVSKLTTTAVKDIRARTGAARQVDLAGQYGVSQTQISKVQRGEAWKHV